MRQGEDHAIIQLLPHGLIDLRIAMSQRKGRQAADEVDVLVAIHIPHMTALATRDEIGRHTERILSPALAESLRTQRDGFQRPLEQGF